ncbi:MAG: hypothetical protein Q8O55_01650 [Dehalococcoidales bacterium]|nr:hypothetical protein [Dehalococcoidales bacterium]
MAAKEKRKEFVEGNEITCPICGSDNLEPDEEALTPYISGAGKCLNCGLKFEVRQVLIWRE